MTDSINPNAALAATLRQELSPDTKIAFVSGNFNVVHPGHLRLLRFARDCADRLVVGINSDDHSEAVLPGELRLESLHSIDFVDHAIILPGKPEAFVAALRPEIVVKGKEHETHFNPELDIVEGYGGTLLFSSGEVQFSSMDLLQWELDSTGPGAFRTPTSFLQRHKINGADLADWITKFEDLNIVVVGDMIVDEYVMCEPLGMSREDTTLVVSPLRKDRFIGGAAIVAAHARGLKANVQYFGIIGDDEPGSFARDSLTGYDVSHTLLVDRSRPTTLKQRYRAHDKTLLRVSHLRHHEISLDLTDELGAAIEAALDNADLLVFSDFSYGCLSDTIVARLTDMATERSVPMVADSQSSSQIGDISRFKGMHLISPTEHEARIAARDNNAGLVVLADKLRNSTGTRNVIITLGAEGVVIHAPETTTDALITDKLPAMNGVPLDVSGAGDSLLICSSMSLAVGANIWESAYLGSVAAGIQVSRVGNRPLNTDQLLARLPT